MQKAPKNKEKAYLWGLAALIALAVIVARLPFGLPIVLGLILVALVVLVAWGLSAPPKAAHPAPRAGGLRRGLYNPSNTIPDLLVTKVLQVELRNGQIHRVFVALRNVGQTPLGPLPSEVSLEYSNFFGSPARGGNHLDGVLIDPSPQIDLLAPGQARRVEIYGPDRPLSLETAGLSDHNAKVAQAVEDAGGIMSFLQADKTGAFALSVRIGSQNHGAYLFARDIAP